MDDSMPRARHRIKRYTQVCRAIQTLCVRVKSLKHCANVFLWTDHLLACLLAALLLVVKSAFMLLWKSMSLTEHVI